MKKKYIKMALLAALTFGFTSCNDWLDIDQNTEKTVDDMFKTYDGFKGALIGCYDDLTKSNLYGSRLTMSNVDALAGLWYMDKNAVDYSSSILDNYYFRIHDYTHSSAEESIKAIYSAMYNAILEINMVIKACQENGQNIPNAQVRAVIEGEAFALRAMCHLDVLRLFGQLPQGATIKVALPYSEVTSIKDNIQYYEFDKFVGKLKADIERAKSLLKDNDPVSAPIYVENYEDSQDPFLVSRENRMNYWALRGIEARMYAYLGDKEMAYSVAKELIDVKDKAGNVRLPLTSMNDYGKAPDSGLRNYASTSESLFSLYFKNLKGIAKALLEGGEPIGSENVGEGYISAVDRSSNLTLTPALFESLFEGVNKAADIRYKFMWSKTQTTQGQEYPTIRKYYVAEAGNVPIIRMSEIYLIAVEYAPDMETSKQLYATYMESKGVAVNNPFDSPEARFDELLKEYRREFFAEGQIFYFYKRHNVKKLWSMTETDMLEDKYILPLPKTEVNPNK